MNFSKLAVLAASTLISMSANAQSKGGSDVGSAFVNNGVLYITTLGDGCNDSLISLDVAPNCLADRNAENHAVTCFANVRIATTRMACIGTEPQATVTAITLKEAKVAKEAKTLVLQLEGKMIKLSLK